MIIMLKKRREKFLFFNDEFKWSEYNTRNQVRAFKNNNFKMEFFNGFQKFKISKIWNFLMIF